MNTENSFLQFKSRVIRTHPQSENIDIVSYFKFLAEAILKYQSVELILAA